MHRLLTDDCEVDGLRQQVIPLWEAKTQEQQRELREICKVQDEISHEAGIREVIEWLAINQIKLMEPARMGGYQSVNREKIHAMFKKWGII